MDPPRKTQITIPSAGMLRRRLETSQRLTSTSCGLAKVESSELPPQANSGDVLVTPRSKAPSLTFRTSWSDLRNVLERWQGDHVFPLEVLFSDSFVRSHTSYSSVRELLDAASETLYFRIGSEMTAAQRAMFDRFLARVSSFSSWSQMIAAAVCQHCFASASETKPHLRR